MNEIYIEMVNQYLVELSKSIEHTELKTMLDAAIESGGKRIRPLLCLLSAQLFSDDYEMALPQAAALELFHTFSLVHDDIMDEAPLRRGVPSTYFKHGRNKAILAGDVMLLLAFSELMEVNDKDKSVRVLACFSNMAVKVCEGQMLDLDFESHQFPDQAAYMKMIEYKTSVLIGASLKIGAIIGGATPEESEKLYQYGVLQGLAFQIQDDILDAYGDPRAIGKRLGGDIIQGKKTLLTILCALKAGAERQKFESLFFDQSMTDEKKIKLVLSAYDKFKIHEDAVLLKNTLIQQGNQILTDLNVDNDKKLALVKLSNWLMNRTY